jgi:hypothetical protein
MNRILFYLVLVFICYPVYGQNTTLDTNSCVENYILEGKTNPKQNHPRNEVTISWDFSRTINKDELEVTLKVQPLNACWKHLEGTNRSDIKIFKILNFSKKAIGSQKIGYMDLNAKCFKWQVVILDSNTNCETITEWQFLSFL